jgi:hypothetical protein
VSVLRLCIAEQQACLRIGVFIASVGMKVRAAGTQDALSCCLRVAGKIVINMPRSGFMCSGTQCVQRHATWLVLKRVWLLLLLLLVVVVLCQI